MDAGSPGGKVQSWVMAEFSSQDEVSRGELIDRAEDAGLAQEIREAIGEMPSGSMSKEAAVHHIVDVLEVRASGGARGQGNAPGAGGFGMRGGPSGTGGSCPVE